MSTNDTQTTAEPIVQDAPKEKLSLEQLREKLATAGKKVLPTQVLDAQMKRELEKTIERLVELKSEISQKVTEVTDQKTQIEAAIGRLTSSKTISVDKAETDEAEKSVNGYIELLGSIGGDVENETNHLKQFAGHQENHIIVAEQNEPDSIDALVALKIRLAKKYVKSVTRDLRVSFSRYSFSFKTQMQRLAYVEHVAAMKRRAGA